MRSLFPWFCFCFQRAFKSFEDVWRLWEVRPPWTEGLGPTPPACSGQPFPSPPLYCWPGMDFGSLGFTGPATLLPPCGRRLGHQLVHLFIQAHQHLLEGNQGGRRGLWPVLGAGGAWPAFPPPCPGGPPSALLPQLPLPLPSPPSECCFPTGPSLLEKEGPPPKGRSKVQFSAPRPLGHQQMKLPGNGPTTHFLPCPAQPSPAQSSAWHSVPPRVNSHLPYPSLTACWSPCPSPWPPPDLC